MTQTKDGTLMLRWWKFSSYLLIVQDYRMLVLGGVIILRYKDNYMPEGHQVQTCIYTPSYNEKTNHLHLCRLCGNLMVMLWKLDKQISIQHSCVDSLPKDWSFLKWLGTDQHCTLSSLGRYVLPCFLSACKVHSCKSYVNISNQAEPHVLSVLDHGVSYIQDSIHGDTCQILLDNRSTVTLYMG